MESKMRVFKDFDEIKAAVGTEVGVSNWIEVTQERIEQFAQATGDNQWIHVDVERAVRELPMGTTIAHGLLTLSFAPVFIRDVMGLEGLKNTLNYGANRVRYLAPVPSGSRLRGRTSIVAAEDAPPDGLRVTYGVTIEIENRERPACVAEVIAVHYRSTAAVPASVAKEAGVLSGYPRVIQMDQALAVYSAVLPAEKYSRGDCSG
jgi:acyl dehydratase